MNANEHKPVLLDEVIKGLNLCPNGFYIDGTFGRGGHSQAVLDALNHQGRLLVFDKDQAAIDFAKQLFTGDDRVTCIHASFTCIKDIVTGLRMLEKVDGVVLDLGISSPQLDNADLGFSFYKNGLLDMRMNRTAGITAADWINTASPEEIERVLRDYGEERYARRIAKAIVRTRTESKITHTLQLADVIAATVPTIERHKHPATRTFLAMRLFINSELEELRTVLSQMQSVLRPGGRLVVISFHSMEDRIVKQFMRQAERGSDYPPEIPITISEAKPWLRKINKAIRPGRAEITRNPRARSAVLRIGEKLAA